MSLNRFDIVKLDRKAIKRTASGAMIVPGRAARTGVQTYTDMSGSEVYEYRPPDEVFAEDSLASYDEAPVTIGHPRSPVTPENWKRFAVGHVKSGSAKRVDIEGDESWVEVEFVVSDADTQDRIEEGSLTEISMGYSVELQDAPADAPYDKIQTGITINHAALLEDGLARAGRGARLRLDGHQTHEEPMSDNNEPKKVVVVDGVELEFGSADHLDAVTTPLRDEAAKLQARVDDLEAKLQESMAKLEDESRIDAEIAFRDDARKLLGSDFDFTGKTRVSVKRAAVEKVRGNSLEGKCDAYIEAAFDICLEDYKPEADKTDSEDYSAADKKADSKKEEKPFNYFQIVNSKFDQDFGNIYNKEGK